MERLDARRRIGFLVISLILIAAVSGVDPGKAQDISAKIERLEIKGLVPLQVSFEFENTGEVDLQNVYGKAFVTDRFGNTVMEIPVNSFSVPAGQAVELQVRSRWEFQNTGIYLLEVALDIGLEVLVTGTLAFRIVPLALPLEPPPRHEGEGLYTVYQQPLNWGIAKIGAPEAWHTTHGSDDVVVAVIDSGIDYTIPQLAGRMWVNEDEIPGNGIDDDRNGYIDDMHGWDFRDNDNDSLRGSEIHWHGTFAASIIAAWPGENAIVGVAPGVRIMDVRFLDSEGLFYSNDWERFAQAINYAVDNGARIINLSIYSIREPPAVVQQALRRAVQRGVIVVGITGNDGQAQVSYPGKFSSVNAVSATTPKDRLARFSNYGGEVLVAAPGYNITALVPGGGVATRSGTSFAAPHVAGALALILSANPSMTEAQAVAVLEETAVDLGSEGPDREYGYGLIYVAEAVIRARR